MWENPDVSPVLVNNYAKWIELNFFCATFRASVPPCVLMMSHGTFRPTTTLHSPKRGSAHFVSVL